MFSYEEAKQPVQNPSLSILQFNGEIGSPKFTAIGSQVTLCPILEVLVAC